MGKATRWLKRFLGFKKESSPPQIQSREQTATSCFSEPKHQVKSKWRNVKSYRQNGRASTDGFTGRSEGSADVTSEPKRSATAGDVVVDPSKKAIVVPAETSAVVQTAVNPTGGERCGVSSAYVSKGYAGFRIRKQWAAVTIQSHFRGYLARRARRALKGLVKLQALVRGNMVRKQTAHMMVRLEALLRAQARARVGRSQSQSQSQSLLLQSVSKSAQFDSHTQGPSTPENFELATSKGKNFSRLKRSGSKPTMLDVDQLTIELDEGSGSGSNSKSKRTFDKEKLESPKPSLPYSSSSNRKSPSPMKPFDRSNSSDQYSRIFTATSIDSTLCHSAQSASSYEAQSLTPVKFLLYPQNEDNHLREPVTPTRSINSLRSTSSHNPSYMSGTQSSRAKTRSLSAPKLRPGLERSTSTTKRVLSLHGYAAADHQTKPFSHGNFEKKAYPGSGQLDLVGMPYYVSEF